MDLTNGRVPPSRRPVIIGILNVTPDSFSDGGRYHDFDDAIEQASRLVEAGADLIDVGGESTRPGAERVPPKKEQGRVLPVIRELIDRGIRVSIDTMNASTAAAALDLGAMLVNDVSGGLADKAMPRLIAESGIDYVAMHWRGHSSSMDKLATYNDVVRDVRNELKHRIAALIVAGVDPAKVILDPGLGFAKTSAHNWQLLGRLRELETLGHRVLIGASRKRFLGELQPEGAPTSDRDPDTATVSALAAESGVWGVRVHDVAATLSALEVWYRWNNGRAPAPLALGGVAATAPTPLYARRGNTPRPAVVAPDKSWSLGSEGQGK
ncbi:MAG: dihydropteroate synthase [Homoserinimonas sp.]|nr:dihydropteroate synthase [Homoserinimonas sp.]